MADSILESGRPVTARKQAKQLGQIRYFTGKPCCSGHVVERLTVNGACTECTRLTRLARYRADPEAELARQKVYRDAHPERAAEKREKRYAADPMLKQRADARLAEKAAREQAAELGKTMYESLRGCAVCETRTRFTGDSKCVECNRTACNARSRARMLAIPGRAEEIAQKKALAKRRAEQKKMVSEAAKAIRDARQMAIKQGHKTYTGRSCAKGHAGLRYTKFGSCVACCAEAAASDEKKRYDAEYLKKNRDRIMERTRVYREANLEAYAAKAAEWTKKNPEKRRAISANYKHKRRAQESSGVSSLDLLRWKKSQKKVCYWCSCKCEKGYAIDHYEPLAKGGLHELSNLVIACRQCNSRKSAKDPFEFAASRGMLF